MGLSTRRQARVIHLRKRSTGNKSKKFQYSCKGESKNRRNRAGADQAMKRIDVKPKIRKEN